MTAIPLDVGDTPEPASWRMYYVRDQKQMYTRPQAGAVARLGEIDQFREATFVLRHNGVGSFVIDADPWATGLMDAINDIPAGDMARHVELLINGRRVFLGPIQGWERRLEAGRHETITMFGNDQNVWLAQRVCHPSPRQSAPEPLPYDSPPGWQGYAPRPWCGAYARAVGLPPDGPGGYDNFTGPAGQAISYYIDQNLGWAAEGGNIPPTTFTDNARVRIQVTMPGPAIGVPVTRSARWGNLLEYVQAIAIEAGEWPLGFQVQAWGLRVWEAVDRGAIFAPEIGNIKSYLGRYQADDANTTYTAGQGEGTHRQTVITHGYGHDAPLMTSAGVPTGPTLPVYAGLVRPPLFGRVETFRDRRDTDDWAVLQAAGLEDCRHGIRRPQIIADALDTATQRYGRDYDLGDIVTVRYAGADIKALVTALTFHLKPGQQPTVAPTLGTETAVAPLSFIRRLDDSAGRINQLERR
jgi:hypothetical protein